MTGFPLRRWSVRRFKALLDVDLELAPLTLIAGRNSSGKSSLIQSILLLTQTARQNPLDQAVSLNGSLVTLGGVDQVRSFFAGEERGIELEASFELVRLLRSRLGQRLYPSTEVEWRLELGDAPENRPGAASVAATDVTITAGGDRLQIALRHEPRPRAETRRAFEAGQALVTAPPTFPLGLVGEVRSDSDEASQPIVGAQTVAAFPRMLFIEDTDVEVFAHEWWNRHALRRPASARQLPQPALFEQATDNPFDRLVRLAAQDLEALRTSESATLEANRRALAVFDQDEELRGRYAEFASALNAAVETPRPVVVPARASWTRSLDQAALAVRQFLGQQVAYLGPLRHDPTVLQRGGTTTAAGDIGTKGELAAAVLYAQRDTMIECPELDGPTQRRRLEAALTQWAQHLGVAEDVRAVDLGRLGIELQVRPVGLDRDVDLSNVGVGVSQLLPVLLVCLLAQPGTLVLLEQPELHLHPAMQQRLGDFLLACARSGRQLVVETHSEHLISRLRLRAAEDPGDEVVQLFKIVFAELDEAGATVLREVRANRYGGIEEWPVGFFDQGVQEARGILDHGLRKKQRDHEVGPES